MVIRRDCRDPGRMQPLVRRMWLPERRFHVGDIAWGWNSVPGPDAAFRLSVWEKHDTVVAWGWLELPGHLDVLVDPAAISLLPAVLDWFEATAPGPRLSCLVMEGERAARAILAWRGYTPRWDGPFFRRYRHDLAGLPAPRLPEGFRIEHVTARDVERRVEVHRAGWSDIGSRLTADSYRAVMASAQYREQTDLVVVAPDGEWVASALGWYDQHNRAGLVEPVSCTPPFRGMGLAAAVNIALLHTFRGLGATCSVILPRGDQAYPAPARLYRSIGYRPGPRTVLYLRDRHRYHRCQ